MPIDDIVDAVAFAGRAIAGVANGLATAETVLSHVFSGHSARFFHGVGRRLLAVVTLGGVRIPSSLRRVPVGAGAKPRRSDWVALWTGILFWIALFVGAGLAAMRWL
ncbi:MAG: hypothetical protein ABW164_02280 [Sphingobium sp.]